MLTGSNSIEVIQNPEDCFKTLASNLDNMPGILIGSNYNYTKKYSPYFSGFDKPMLKLEVYSNRVELSPFSANGQIMLKAIVDSIAEKTTTLDNKVYIYSTGQQFKALFFDLINKISDVLDDSLKDNFFGIYGAISFNFVKAELSSTGLLAVFYIPEALYSFECDDAGRVIKAVKTTYSLKGDAASDIPLENNTSSKAQSHLDDYSGELKQFSALVTKAQKTINENSHLETVNPSVAIALTTQKQPSEVFKTLLNINQAPYNFLINFDNGYYYVGASPAMYLRGNSHDIYSSPIAGTIIRGKTSDEDDINMQKLISSEKDDAELKKCIKMDIEIKQKTCKSWKIETSKEIEKFSNVFHTSTYISGQLKDDLTIYDALFEHMWPGTVVGYPREKALKFILENELSNRMWYSGCVGYIRFNGTFDFGLSIRSVLLDQHNHAITRVGTSIMGGSIVQVEEAELLAKAALIKRALE